MKTCRQAILPKWEKTIEALNIELKALSAIEKVAKKFDGKVINKRFIDVFNVAKKDLAVYLSREERYNSDVQENITTFALDINPRIFTYRYTYYNDTRIGQISSLPLSLRHRVDGKIYPYIHQDGRMNYEDFEEVLDHARKEVKKRISKYKKAIRDYEKNIAKIKEVNRKIQELKEEFYDTPYMVETDRIELYYFDY